MTEQKLEGGCQCGNVRYTIVGAPVMAAICHCSMCRKAHAAPAVAWAMFPDSQVTYTRQKPKQFRSSEEAQRGFCSTCGTQISFTASFLPGLIDISIGSLDKPESIEPLLHYWYSKHLSWAEFADNLPRYPQLPPFGEDEG
jgi:hypothetical protein